MAVSANSQATSKQQPPDLPTWNPELAKRLKTKEKVIAILCDWPDTVELLKKLINEQNASAKVWDVINILQDKGLEELIKFFQKEVRYIDTLRLIVDAGITLDNKGAYFLQGVQALNRLLADQEIGNRIVRPVLVLSSEPISTLFFPEQTIWSVEGRRTFSADTSHGMRAEERFPLPTEGTLPIKIPVKIDILKKALEQLIEGHQPMIFRTEGPDREALPFCQKIHWSILVIDDEVDRYESSNLKRQLNKKDAFPGLKSNTTGIYEGKWSAKDGKKIIEFDLTLKLRGTDFAVKLLNGDREAQEEIMDRDLDLVLLDVRFGEAPQLQELGLELVPEIKKIRNKDLPIFMLSAFDEPHLLEKAIGRGACSYYVKQGLSDQGSHGDHTHSQGRAGFRVLTAGKA